MRVSFEIITKQSDNKEEVETTIVTVEAPLKTIPFMGALPLFRSLSTLFNYKSKLTEEENELIDNFVKTLPDKIVSVVKERPEFSTEDLSNFQDLVNQYVDRLDEDDITVTGIVLNVTDVKIALKSLEDKILKLLREYLLKTEIEIIAGNVDDSGTPTIIYNVTIPFRTMNRCMKYITNSITEGE